MSYYTVFDVTIQVKMGTLWCPMGFAAELASRSLIGTTTTGTDRNQRPPVVVRIRQSSLNSIGHQSVQ
ncbi:hypothetical protein HZA86_00670 [Candidatus Uhrbacteria bacterium]|nr:hypothetical protein [Candidatus Uhrbacteria bacterium]